MARAARIVIDTLDALEAAAVPGATTGDLDRIARESIEKAGARPAFLGYRGFPATLCASVNEEVVHGIPGSRKLREGDIVGLDLGCILDGFFGDSARTVAVGRISQEADSLMKATRGALLAGVDMCRPNKRVGDIGHAVQSHAESRGYSVVREFVGHGMIEPMVNAGVPEVEVLGDGWTAVTKDRRLSAHFEFAVAVTPHGPWILSESYPYAAFEAEAANA
jgi:methionyl aminopeptidase